MEISRVIDDRGMIDRSVGFQPGEPGPARRGAQSRRRLALRFALVASLLALVGGLMVARADQPGGIGHLWEVAFGPIDQGPVDFTRLSRRSTPNDALVCPRSLCPAVPDLVSPSFRATPDELRDRIRSVILASPDAMQVAEATAGTGDRFVVRTPLLRFPDTVDVMVVASEDGRTGIALYSRSLIGHGDGGTNLRRLKAWLADPQLRAIMR